MKFMSQQWIQRQQQSLNPKFNQGRLHEFFLVIPN
uniref:Uncharacterized protein n=1 Tax=Rhizophora mucronata TaxID=61149 RepID=A0A2P2QA99_RHIMU